MPKEAWAGQIRFAFKLAIMGGNCRRTADGCSGKYAPELFNTVVATVYFCGCDKYHARCQPALTTQEYEEWEIPT
ncbi:MAG: hypothetical protein U0Z17_03065 [Bacteroidales bacterium]